jgi:hypothetical protein
MSDTPEFVNGLIFKMPHESAPDFVKGSLSIRREELLTFLTGKTEEWINVDLKVSKAGKAYAQVNTFKPESRQDMTKRENAVQGGGINGVEPQQSAPANNDFDSDIPF